MEKNTFLVSDESLNSHGFSLLTDGIDITNFLKNPIMLYMHERPEIIGYWTNVQKKDGKLYADAVFDTDSVKGKEIARQVEGGFLRGASVGVTEIERSGDVVTKSELVEISIVDIGSNSNALKLYKEPAEMIHLSFNTDKSNQDLNKILGLSGTFNQSLVVTAVRNLKSENTRLSLELNGMKTKINEEREKEADRLTNLAVTLGYIPENLKHVQKLAFTQDYDKVKNELQELIDKSMAEERKNYKLDFINGFLDNAKINGLIDLKDRTKKPVDKSQWTLKEYRMFAPKDLEENPELYQKLIKEEFNKNK